MRVRGVALDHPDPLDCAGERDVQRVDVELPNFQRPVLLVLRAPVVERLDREVGRIDARADLGISLALSGHETVKDDGRIFQALGLVHRKHQRRAEARTRGQLVLVAQDQHRALGRAARARVDLAPDAQHPATAY